MNASAQALTPSSSSDAAHVADVVRRIKAEYNEMPGLSLTIVQASRLFGLDADACRHVLLACVDAGFLREASGRFARA